MLACTSTLIYQSTNNIENWQYRQAGFTFLGMIAEACSKKFKKDFTDTVKLIGQGLFDSHERVRYSALMALGLILNVASPQIQMQHHGDLMQVFLNMMQNENLIKLKSQAVSATINFVRGMVESEDQDLDDDQIKK